MHLGIFIKGKRPAKHQYLYQADLSKLVFRKIAPLHLRLISFKGEILPYDLIQEVKPIFESGLMTPVAFIIFRKDQDGR
jgi:hypothetical protein